jgi:hypothetical protein
MFGGGIVNLNGGDDGSFKIGPSPGYFLAGFLRTWPANAIGFELRAARWWLLAPEKDEPTTVPGQPPPESEPEIDSRLELQLHVLFGDSETPKSVGFGYSHFGEAGLATLMIGFGF